MTNPIFVEKFTIGNGKIKVAVKDSISVAGYRTRLGSAALESVSPDIKHASVVERILSAGCQLVGKLNMHEFAYGMTGVNHWAGTPVNHLYPDYIPGGSSSGSAVAVAKNVVDFSLGTDTGGSIRLPAACCGVYGFKPTFGRVSREGVSPCNTTLDCVGPFAKSIDGIIKAMVMIDDSFKPLDSPTDIKIGFINVDADKAVLAATKSFLKEIGGEQTLMELPLLSAAFEAGLILINDEAWNAYGHLLASEKIGEDVVKRLTNAEKTTKKEIQAAEKIRNQFTQEVNTLLGQANVLVLPTLPTLPMLRKEAFAGKVDLNISLLVRPFNLSGHPAITMPLTKSEYGPIGIQLVAAKGQDEFLCAVAKQFSEFLD